MKPRNDVVGRGIDGQGRVTVESEGDAEDAYRSGDYLWWHLSRPSPELRQALAQGWLPAEGRVLDLGCGLAIETKYLGELGMVAVGVDLSLEALRMASPAPLRSHFVQGDVTCLPFRTGMFDALLDRFCFHWIPPQDQGKYETEARRVLRPQGRLLLRTCLKVAGVRSDIDERTLRKVFKTWRTLRVERRQIPSDSREIDALFLVLERP